MYRPETSAATVLIVINMLRFESGTMVAILLELVLQNYSDFC